MKLHVVYLKISHDINLNKWQQSNVKVNFDFDIFSCTETIQYGIEPFPFLIFTEMLTCTIQFMWFSLFALFSGFVSQKFHKIIVHISVMDCNAFSCCWYHSHNAVVTAVVAAVVVVVTCFAYLLLNCKCNSIPSIQIQRMFSVHCVSYTRNIHCLDVASSKSI